MRLLGSKTAAALALTLGANAAASSTAPIRGSVVFATARTLYLDKGEADGLAPGSAIELHRNGRAVGTCRIAHVARRHASCTGPGAAGDTFQLADRPPAKAETPPQRPPPLATQGALAAQHRAVLAAGFEKVDFAAPPRGVAAARRFEVRITHATWASTDVGPWHQERLDARIDGAAAFGGFSLWADLSARRWSRRSETVSARPDDPTQLYVWEAALTRRGGPGSLALSLGRVRPWSAPGATILDGAQAGWITSSGAEVGVFGGVVPDLITLAPSVTRGTGGAYFRVEKRGDAGALLRLAREETRLAFTSSPELGQRVEAELLGQLWLVRDLSLSANARFALGDRSAPGGLDALRIDLGARPARNFSLSGGFRYQGLSVPERDGPGTVGYGGAARHADLSAAWDAADWITLSAVSGLSTDLVSSLNRQYFGPEVGLPQLFGALGGASIGYAQETGWSSGHDAWAQIITRTRALQLLARLSWFRTGGLEPTADNEIGGYLHVSAQVGPFVTLRLAALGRLGGVVGGSPFASTGSRGGSLDASIAGVF